ncbi:putative Prolipoprotein diacylglyceryl transferase [Candidatus Promineifilum breve]|uniref:Prolipoprotein diacylglyceryl transferase n=1 Tax=Candidatus Promineifilum breve TaxID=1806508 RepID=A0A160T663_9CHLR|nr:prolipoprotein diacylglyceryl transferase family protein [Candidatus Promineifilum breve]CUS04728.2 putative Prolipoprotein diacylglyceryl transferase [Candidatus Promineifilum breve]
MLPYLNLGPIGLPTAPLIYLLGVWLALFAVDRAARRLGQAPEPIYGVAAAMLLGGFVGARLVFVALYWSSFDDNLLGIVWPLTSGYHAAGGVVIGLAAGFFYGRWRRLALWPALDALAPGLIVFLMAVSLADFLGGAGYGSLTAMPWGINQFGVRRHAVQLYEVAAGLAALGVWWAATSPRLAGRPGRPALLAVAVYAAGRLFVDAFKETTPLTSGGFHVVQIVALALVLLMFLMLARPSLR